MVNLWGWGKYLEREVERWLVMGMVEIVEVGWYLKIKILGDSCMMWDVKEGREVVKGKENIIKK